ncbi:MAG: response regulator [Actinomycetota bacterium]
MSCPERLGLTMAQEMEQPWTTHAAPARTVRGSSTSSDLTAGLAMLALREADLHRLAHAACERLAASIEATVTLVAVDRSGDLVVRASSSKDVPDASLSLRLDDPDVLILPLPDGGAAERLVVDPAPISPDAIAAASAIAEVLAAASCRSRSDSQVRSSEERLRMAQRLAHLGSYDWEIATDTNRWSDEMYRIYGCEPQSFNASYEKFLSFIHPDDREKVQRIHRTAFETLEPYEMEERIVRPDGEERILKSNGIVITDQQGNPVRMTGICWDITELKHAEKDRAKLREMETARTQALTINDNIVQGLASALGHLRSGDDRQAELFLEETLGSARRMMDELMNQTYGLGGLKPGDLIRPEAAVLTSTGRDIPPAAPGPVGEAGIRVVIADDTPAMRHLTRHILADVTDVVIVGEAADGREAIDLTNSLAPDVLILDLAMPEVDGLTVIPQVRGSSPHTRILVLTGYGEEVGKQAMDLGAHSYLGKGSSMDELRSEVLRLAELQTSAPKLSAM